jgi:hypothetical protein
MIAALVVVDGKWLVVPNYTILFIKKIIPSSNSNL